MKIVDNWIKREKKIWNKGKEEKRRCRKEKIKKIKEEELNLP